MRFENFRIWRGKLPHWRADDVTYYATFRHRRPLQESERRILLKSLLKPDSRRWDVMIVCVLPEQTEILFKVRESPQGEAYELSDILEKSKGKAGRQIIKVSGERFPPFYTESYDRIVRDEAELEERWLAILGSPVEAELVEDPDDYVGLWVSNMTDL